MVLACVANPKRDGSAFALVFDSGIQTGGWPPLARLMADESSGRIEQKL